MYIGDLFNLKNLHDQNNIPSKTCYYTKWPKSYTGRKRKINMAENGSAHEHTGNILLIIHYDSYYFKQIKP